MPKLTKLIFYDSQVSLNTSLLQVTKRCQFNIWVISNACFFVFVLFMPTKLTGNLHRIWSFLSHVTETIAVDSVHRCFDEQYVHYTEYYSTTFIMKFAK